MGSVRLKVASKKITPVPVEGGGVGVESGSTRGGRLVHKGFLTGMTWEIRPA